MKSRVVGLVAMLALGVVAGELSLTEARGKLSDVISDPSLMTATMKQLSADDQKSFLADVNEAIGKMPGSVENVTATFLNANKAALRGAQKGNLSALLAEVFATVSPEALTVINESFASDLFNRASDPAAAVSDERFAALSSESMKKIAERNATADNSAPRDAFAVMMFVRASNGLPTNLVSTLSEFIPAESREVATKEWLPAALGEDKSYDAILGACDSGRQPAPEIVLRIAGAQMLETMLTDLPGGKRDSSLVLNQSMTQIAFRDRADRGGIGAGIDNGLYRVPFEYRKGVEPGPIPPGPTPHPDPYDQQKSYRARRWR